MSDYRQPRLFGEAERLYASVRRAGGHSPVDAAELCAINDVVVFTGTFIGDDKLSKTKLCRLDLLDGRVSRLFETSTSEHTPALSTDGLRLAFLSDQEVPGDFQLHVASFDGSERRAIPPLDARIESIAWAPDARQILIVAADQNSDRAAIELPGLPQTKTSEWQPMVRSNADMQPERTLWVADAEKGECVRLPIGQLSVWEAVWLGGDAIAVIASDGPTEADWYRSRLYRLDIATGVMRLLYQPAAQLGHLAAAGDGSLIAVVEALSSDRGLLAGDLVLIDPNTGRVNKPATGMDISCTVVRSPERILLAGHRGLSMVIGEYSNEDFAETFTSDRISSGGPYAVVTAFGSGIGDCLLVSEGFAEAPAVTLLSNGEAQSLVSFDAGYTKIITSCLEEAIAVSWLAPDGLEIEGWLLRARNTSSPRSLVMELHGGPVLHWKPRWLGRTNLSSLLLLSRGHDLFWPNPRGSSGRGQAFAAMVRGDMGGADARDCLAGLDHLVSLDLAEPDRITVTGVSYGGFLTAWLITLTTRFAAAAAVCPITDWVSQHYESNIPFFDDHFLARPDVQALSASARDCTPLTDVAKITTPTLLVAGQRDRCTPPSQAILLHNALREHGQTTDLVIYPTEAHGIRSTPSLFDHAARLVDWIESHLPGSIAGGAPSH